MQNNGFCTQSEQSSAPVADPAPIVPSTLQHDRRGRFAAGNSESHKHGMYSAQLRAALDGQRAAFLAGSLTDDGGEGVVATRRRSLHDYRARLHVHIGQISDALARFGLFDSRGRLRATWLQRLE